MLIDPSTLVSKLAKCLKVKSFRNLLQDFLHWKKRCLVYNLWVRGCFTEMSDQR